MCIVYQGRAFYNPWRVKSVLLLCAVSGYNHTGHYLLCPVPVLLRTTADCQCDNDTQEEKIRFYY